MRWGCLFKTVTRMEAGAEPPGMVLRRVLDGYPQLMSRTGWFNHKLIYFNGTTMRLNINSDTQWWIRFA